MIFIKHTRPLPVLLFAAASAFAAAPAPDIPLFDFDGPAPLDGWKNDGLAFHAAEVTAPNHGKVRVEGAQGARFLYSFDSALRTNAPAGTLASPEFIIGRDYINFLLGGGRSWPDVLGAQLVVDGSAVRSSTGSDARAGFSFRLIALNWDVREFRGKRAHIVFNDKSPFGSLGADQFVMSDTPRGWRSDATVRFAEKYRPAFHASAGTGRSGDANGMFWLDGVWHLGFQLYYIGTGGFGWGRVTSRDLVHWTQTDDIVPAADTGTAASGGATVDHLNTSGLRREPDGPPPVLLFYTRHPPGASSAFPDTPLKRAPKSADLRYHPAIAYSIDGGKTFTKDTASVFRHGDPHMLTYDRANTYTLDGGRTWTRDPSALLGAGGFGKDRDGKVFYHAPTGDWIMIWHLSQNNDRERTAFGLYRSKNFKKWELFQTIPGMWECPDMFEMPVIGADGKPTGKKYWIVSRGGVEYFAGTFNGKEFVPLTINDPKTPAAPVRFSDPAYDKKRCLRRVTLKSGCYAAQTFANAPGGRIVQVSWLSGPGLAGAPSPGSPWENMLSFPVELTLREKTGGSLVLEHVPVREIEKIYAKTHEQKNLRLAEGVTQNLLPLTSNLLDIDVTFEPAGARRFGLEVLGEKIIYDTAAQKLIAFRSLNAKTNRLVENASVVPLSNGKINLRILVDRSSIEVGVNNGVHRTTTLVYPQDEAAAPAFISEGGRAKIERLIVREIECSQR